MWRLRSDVHGNDRALIENVLCIKKWHKAGNLIMWIYNLQEIFEIGFFLNRVKHVHELYSDPMHFVRRGKYCFSVTYFNCSWNIEWASTHLTQTLKSYSLSLNFPYQMHDKRQGLLRRYIPPIWSDDDEYLSVFLVKNE